MVTLVVVGVFLSTLGLIAGGYLVVNRQRLAAAQAARARLIAEGIDPTRPSILRDTSASTVPFLDELLSGRAFTERLARTLSRAGLDIIPGTFLIGCALSAALAGLVGGTLTPGLGWAWTIAGAVAPVLWLRRRVAKRLSRFEEQLPDAMDMLVAAMRAGYSFQAAMKFVGEEMAEPLGREFAQFYEQQRLGMDVRAALLALPERVPSIDLKMFVTAVLVQRDTGGNLSEVLTNIADVIRDRFDVKREVDTLTAEARLSARVLSALPVAVFLLMLVVDPGFLKPMIEQFVGRVMLVVAGASIVVGHFLMSSIADVEV